MKTFWPALACATTLVATQNLPSMAEEYSLFSPQPTSIGRFGEVFGSLNFLKEKEFVARNAGSIVLEDDQYTGAIFVRCITDRPDFLVVFDLKKAVLNGDQANIRIKADGQPERQFYGRVYGDRFVQLDDPLSAIAAVIDAQTFVVGVDVSGVQSVLEFVGTTRPLKTLAGISQCQVPVTARGK